MPNRLKHAALLSGLLAAASAGAWQPPQVEYSADSYMETADRAMRGRVHYAPGKERREYSEGGQNMVMIIRHDRKRMWMLMPEQKMYVDMDMQAAGGRNDDISAYKIERTRVGEENVNGVPTTKYRIIMTGPDGNRMDGFFWTTRENIVIKMDATAADGGNQARFKTELKNLKVGPQDPALFEVPPDYAGVPAGMGGLGGMMGGGTAEAPPPKAPEEKGGGGFSLQDALKLLR